MTKSYFKQSGFTLVQAVFILVVLGLLGMVMMRLIGVQTSTGVLALQQARAYHAARSGLEWGAARALSATPVCDAESDMTIEGFEVTVRCDEETDINEGTETYSVFIIASQATFGASGSADYVSRTVQMKVGNYGVE